MDACYGGLPTSHAPRPTPHAPHPLILTHPFTNTRPYRHTHTHTHMHPRNASSLTRTYPHNHISASMPVPLNPLPFPFLSFPFLSFPFLSSPSFPSLLFPFPSLSFPFLSFSFPSFPSLLFVAGRYIGLGLAPDDAALLSEDVSTKAFFDAVVATKGSDAKEAAKWILGDVFSILKEKKLALAAPHAKEEGKGKGKGKGKGEEEGKGKGKGAMTAGMGGNASALTPRALSSLVSLIASGKISGKIAKQILPELVCEGGDPEAIVEREGLGQISDDGAVEGLVLEVIAAVRTYSFTLSLSLSLSHTHAHARTHTHTYHRIAHRPSRHRVATQPNACSSLSPHQLPLSLFLVSVCVRVRLFAGLCALGWDLTFLPFDGFDIPSIPRRWISTRVARANCLASSSARL